MPEITKSIEPSNKKFVEKFKFFAALTSSSASSSPTLPTDNGSTTTTHKSMITIGAPPKKPVAKSLSDVTTYYNHASFHHNNHETNNNNKNYREFESINNKLVNNITIVLITNDNTEVINHYLMQRSGYDSLPSCAYLNNNQTNNKIIDETIDESVGNTHQSMITLPTQTVTSTANKPKRLMRKIGKLMLPKMFVNESNNNENSKKFKDPIIEDLIKKSNHDKSKVGRIKSLFMSSSVTSVVPETPDSQNDSGKENESGNENGIDELKRQWSIRSETKIHTPQMHRRLSQYFNGSTNQSCNILPVINDSETKKNAKNKEKLSISINQPVFDYSSITSNGDNITPITPLESPIYFSDTSCSVVVNNDNTTLSQYFASSENNQRRLLKQSTPLIRAVKRRIASNSFQRFHQNRTSTLLFPVREFEDIHIDHMELKEADQEFEKLYKRLHPSSN